MSLQDFIAKYTNQFIDFDGQFGAQCVDLINQYCVDVLGISNPIQELPGDTAYDIYQNYSGTKFQKIANTSDGVPDVGDFVFWDTSIGSGGHCDVFVSGDQNTINGFDQNFPIGSPCHMQTHSYGGVMGWLHPISTPVPTVSVDQPTFDKLVHNSTVSDEVNDYLGTPHNSDFDPTIKDKLDELKNKPPLVITKPEGTSTTTIQLPINNPSIGTTSSQATSITSSAQVSSNQPNLDAQNTAPQPFKLFDWFGSLFKGIFGKGN